MNHRDGSRPRRRALRPPDRRRTRPSSSCTADRAPHHDYLLPGFDALADGRELIYYDQRGGGRSPVRARRAGRLDRARRRPRGAARALGARPADDRRATRGAGCSRCCTRWSIPDRVERLALVSPAPSWRAARERFEQRVSASGTSTRDFQEARRALRESGLRERDPAAFQRRIFELSVAPYFHDPARARDLTPFRVDGPHPAGSLGQPGRLRSPRPTPVAPRYPLRWSSTAKSDPIPIEAARDDRRADRRGTFIRLPRCGHVPYVEAHEEFTRRGRRLPAA